MGGGDACGRFHWGLLWSSLEPRRAVVGCGHAYGRRQWGLRWNPVPDMGPRDATLGGGGRIRA
eukprot:5023172-Pyramimonas_sp.AAC.1